MTITEKVYTNEEFWVIAQLPENENKRLELINGVIYEKGGIDAMASSSRRNTVVALRIGRLLGNFVDARQLGYIAEADGGFALDPGHVRQPDVAFIAKTRVDTLAGATFDGSPDLTVEIISPTETARHVIDKARAYLEAGGRLVWAVYPEEQVVDVYRLSETGSLIVDTYDHNGTLDGGETLPGFALPVKDIFPAE